jgi:hypothetical protein
LDVGDQRLELLGEPQAGNSGQRTNERGWMVKQLEWLLDPGDKPNGNQQVHDVMLSCIMSCLAA